jgi:hypothetical protein
VFGDLTNFPRSSTPNGKQVFHRLQSFVAESFSQSYHVDVSTVEAFDQSTLDAENSIDVLFRCATDGCRGKDRGVQLRTCGHFVCFGCWTSLIAKRMHFQCKRLAFSTYYFSCVRCVEADGVRLELESRIRFNGVLSWSRNNEIRVLETLDGDRRKTGIYTRNPKETKGYVAIFQC